MLFVNILKNKNVFLKSNILFDRRLDKNSINLLRESSILQTCFDNCAFRSLGLLRSPVNDIFRSTTIGNNELKISKNQINSPLFFQNSVFILDRKAYNPRRNINWIRNRFRWRVTQLRKKKLKQKNHSKVALRFRLTRFGWERLKAGRHGKKMSWNRKKWRRMFQIAYVSRHDIKKFKFQMPSYVMRIRDPPVDFNPNLQKVRKKIKYHFG